jgi:outer membrane protein assembly factor BamB
MKSKHLLCLSALALLTSFFVNAQFKSYDPIYFPEYVYNIPFIDDYNNVYVSTGNYLHSLTVKGYKNWRFQTNGENIYPESLCKSRDGKILFAAYDEMVYCVDTTGNLVWNYQLRGLTERYRDGCHIVCSDNNYFVVSSADSFIYVLNSIGILQWKKKFHFPFASPAGVYKDSIIYCAPNLDTAFYALNFDGNLLWQFHPGYKTYFKKAPAVSQSGDVCVYAENYYGNDLLVLNKNGKVKYNQTITWSSMLSDPYFDNNNNLYFGYGYYVRCLDSIGNFNWQFLTKGYVYSSPRIGLDGNLYFGSDDGNLYCLDPLSGNEKYSFHFNEKIRYPVEFGNDGSIFCITGYPMEFGGSGKIRRVYNPEPASWIIDSRKLIKSPALSTNGIIVACSIDSVFAFTDSGSALWNYNNSGDSLEVPVIFDNSLIITSRNKITCLDLLDGALIWQKDANGQFFDSPGIGPDASIYIGSTDNNLYAYSPDGEIKWSYAADNDILYSPAITSAGDVVFCCQSGNLYSLDSDGNLNFKVGILPNGATTSYISSNSPTIDSNGNIYIGTEKNNKNIAALLSFSINGNLNWSRLFGSDYQNFNMYPPTFDKENHIYFRFSGSLESYNPDGTLRWNDEKNQSWSVNFGEQLLDNPTIDNLGNIYVSTSYGNIYKVNDSGDLIWVYNDDNDIVPSSIFIGDAGKYFFTGDSKLQHIVDSNNPSQAYCKNKSDIGNTNLFHVSEIISSINAHNDPRLEFAPNPVKSIGTFSYPEDKSIHIEIYNASGALINSLDDKDQNGKTSMDFLNLDSGLYLYRLIDGEGIIYKGKLVKE